MDILMSAVYSLRFLVRPLYSGSALDLQVNKSSDIDPARACFITTLTFVSLWQYVPGPV